MKKNLITICAQLFVSVALYAQQPTEARTFIYGEEVEPQSHWVIDSCDTRPLASILDAMLEGSDVRYRITSRHILLYKEKEVTRDKKQYNLHGYVTDAQSKETLIGANVYCPAYHTGTVTNAYGFYTLPLPEGRHTLVISYVGYVTETCVVNVEKDEVIHVPLQPSSLLEEVLVESDRPETGAASTHMSAHTVTLQQIEQTPTLLGEADVLKTLQRLPGVQSGFTGTSQMSVRGGNLDQNLTLLDGVPLYNVHHVMGFVSAFMPDAVKHVDFFKGSFPSRYGGRLSSVVDVRTKDGDMQHYHGHVSVGLLTSHLSVEGPLVKDRTSFLISGRRTYIGWLISTIAHIADEVDHFDLYFYDLNAKLNHRFSDTDRLFVSYYRGQDGYRADWGYNSHDVEEVVDETGQVQQVETGCKSDYLQNHHWGNSAYTVRWNHLFSPSLFSNLTVGYVQFHLLSDSRSNIDWYQNKEKTSYDAYHSKFSSGIDDILALYDFDYHPTQQHHVKIGSSYTWHRSSPEVQTLSSGWSMDGQHFNQDSRTGARANVSHEAALYVDDDMTLGDRWQLQTGLRGEVYGVKGKAYATVDPRLSVSYLWSPGWHAKASYTQMHQYVHQLTTSLISMPSDLWVSVTKNFRPMSAHQWAMGLACDRWAGWEFSLETYWKEMRHVLEYIDGASYSGSSKGWVSKVASGEGRSRGLELMASRKQGRTTGNLSYTLSWSDRCFPDRSINNGRRYPYDYDRRHNIQVLLQHQFTRRIDVSANWSYLSGGRATVAKQKTWYVAPENMFGSPYPGEDSYYSGRNNYQLKSRHQLDVGINFRRPTKHGLRTWNISIVNAYMHKNQDVVWLEEKDGRMRVKQLTIFPFLPSCSYSYKF